MHAKPAPRRERLAVTVLFCSVSCTALSQDEPDGQPQSAVLEEVIVLGSHIPRADYSSISPVYTISLEEVAIDSRDTAAEMLNRYPQFSGDSNNIFNEFGTRAGAAPLNLRGLGANRNLIMINGRRLGPSSAIGQVDTNSLPVGLVERVEVLTGGAATTYGADALSGVVNFALRDDIDGLELNASFERTDRNDGDLGNISVLGGTDLGKGRGHITGFVGYLDGNAIGRSERKFSTRVLCDDTASGVLFPCGVQELPGGYQPRPALLDGVEADQGFRFDADGIPVPVSLPEDLFNFFPYRYLRPAVRRSTVGVLAKFQMADTTVLNADLLWSDYAVEQTYSPSPIRFEDLIVNLDNPVLSPAAREVLAENFEIGSSGFAFFPYRYRSLVLGERRQKSDRENTWLNLELEGKWWREWRWTAAYTLTDYVAKTKQTGGFSAAHIRQAVLVDPATGECIDTTGDCSPADIFGLGRLSAEAAAYIREGAFVSREDTRQQVISLLTSGSVPLTTNFDVDVALGLEWREDQSKYRPDIRLTDSDFEGFLRETPVSGRDRVNEIYAELLVPVAMERPWAERLEIELGARYSDYSHADGEWTWKSGLSWTPASGVRFRGMYELTARSPNIVESYSPTTQQVNTDIGNSVNDPCAASRRPQDFPGYVERCIAQGIAPENLAGYEPSPISNVVVVNSGNPDLNTEMADTYTLGLVWTPDTAHGFSMALDAYRIEIEDAIVYLSPGDAFQLCFLADNPDKFCAGIERNATGDVTRRFGSFYNLAAITTSGYDLSLDYLFPHRAPWGWPSELSLRLVANRVASFELVGEAGGRWECAGKFGTPCTVGHQGPLPEYSALTRLQYRTGPFSTTLTWQWIDGTENASSLIADRIGRPLVESVPALDSEHYLDLNLAWQWRESATVSLSILNLTDTSPPLLGRSATQANTDPGTYDVLGRRYKLGILARF